MKCQACGADAFDIGGGRFRCKYCSFEFVSVEQTHTVNLPTNKTPAKSFITGGIPLGSKDFKDPNDFIKFKQKEYEAANNDDGNFANGPTLRPEDFDLSYSQINAKNRSSEANLAKTPSNYSAPNHPFSAPENQKPKERHTLRGSEIFENAINVVVEIYASNDSKNVMSSSGFIISSDGFILTNAHAVLDPFGQVYKNIEVKSAHGTYKAMVVAMGKPADGKNDSIDLCLLYVYGLSVEPNEFGDVSLLKNGETVYIIGNSLGSGTCITSGIISDKARAIPGLSYPYIMTDAAANPGNSGGPLYNEYGEIIGVLVAGINGVEGMNYAIPSNVIDAFMSHVINSTDMKKANINELNKYSTPYSNYSLSLVFEGIKLAMDVIEFIVKIFKKD